MDLRHCNDCSQSKPNIEFYHWPKSKKKWSNYCRNCTKKRHREWYKTNENAQRKYQRAKAKLYWKKPEYRARVKAYRAKRRRENPKYRASEIKQSHRSRLRRYDLTAEEYTKFHDQQNGACAICLQVETSTRLGRRRDLAIDHVHGLKVVRGLLCNRCNRGIGYFRDDPLLLDAAIRYLSRSRRKI